MTYDSRLEAKCAVCLLQDHVSFEPHVRYEVIDRNGDPFNYEIDFDLEKPAKLSGLDQIVDSIEVKGVLKPHDFDRKEAYEYTYDRNMWIATPALIEYWYEHGIQGQVYQDSKN